MLLMNRSENFQKPTLSFVCSEDWNKMSLCAQGRFCGSCQKTVVDFTQKSEIEIREVLLKQEGKVCGRFYAHQLSQPVQNNFSFRRFVSAALVFLGLSFLSKEAEAQQKKTQAKKQPVKGKQPVINKRKAFDVQKQKDIVLIGDIATDIGYIATWDNGGKPDLTGIEGLGQVAIDSLSNLEIFDSPEILPVFKFGGQAGLQKFLKENMRVTQDDADGLVVITFVIDTLGNVQDIKILKSLSPGYDKEAIRLASLLTFEPGLMNGKKIKVKYNLPIRFKIERGD